MAAGGSSMNNQQRQNLLQLLSGVNFPNINDNIQEAVHSGEEEAVNTEEMRRDYLLGKIITDILNNVNPTISNSTLNDLKGKNFSQLWQMIKWAKKVEYGANKESGELKVLTMEDMAFDPRIKEEINKVLERVHSAAGAGGGAASLQQNTSHSNEPENIQDYVKNIHRKISAYLAIEGNNIDKRRSIAALRRSIEKHLAKNIPANARQELEEIHRMADRYLTEYMKQRTFTLQTKTTSRNVTPNHK